MKRLWFVLCGLVITCGCGGGGGGGGGSPTPPSTPPEIYVTISPAAQTNIDPGQTVKFTATLQNDTNSKGVSWSGSGVGLRARPAGPLPK